MEGVLGRVERGLQQIAGVKMLECFRRGYSSFRVEDVRNSSVAKQRSEEYDG